MNADTEKGIREEFREVLLKKLPPVIARKHITHFLGGLISPKTLANADSLGEGPKKSYKVGKTVVYQTEYLIDWIIDTMEVKRFNQYLENL